MLKAASSMLKLFLLRIQSLGVKVPQQPNYKNNQYINHAHDGPSSSLATARISLSRRLELLSPRRGALSLSYDSFLFGLRLVKVKAVAFSELVAFWTEIYAE